MRVILPNVEQQNSSATPAPRTNHSVVVVSFAISVEVVSRRTMAKMLHFSQDHIFLAIDYQTAILLDVIALSPVQVDNKVQGCTHNFICGFHWFST